MTVVLIAMMLSNGDDADDDLNVNEIGGNDFRNDSANYIFIMILLMMMMLPVVKVMTMLLIVKKSGGKIILVITLMAMILMKIIPLLTTYIATNYP